MTSSREVGFLRSGATDAVGNIGDGIISISVLSPTFGTGIS